MPVDSAPERKRALKLSSGLLLGGFLLNGVVTMAYHPSGAEDDHEAIFAEYAESGGWVATHLGQFVGVLLALAGLLVLARVLRPEAPHLALFAAAGTVATAASWAVLQALDGVALKQAVDAWVAASGPEKATRFATAEAVRWLEWGFQSYFRLLFGLTLIPLGVAIASSRLIASWLGVLLVVAGLLSLAIGVSVGYAGLESGFQDAVGIAFQLVVLVFIVGLLVVGRRARGPAEATGLRE
jgi:Domain of unknown function (DUF4386)